jgi:RimJ/RimL family protein N-acetyltransferase
MTEDDIKKRYLEVEKEVKKSIKEEKVINVHKKGDEFSLTKNVNNKKIAKNMLEGFPNPYTLDEAKKWVKKMLYKYRTELPVELVIDIDGKNVGAMGGEIKKEQSFIFGFGYWLGEDYWGRGIMSKAIKLYINYIFKNVTFY